MNIYVNSIATEVESFTEIISYERLCLEVGIDPKHNPTVAFYGYGICATIEAGESLPLVNNARYSIIPKL